MATAGQTAVTDELAALRRIVRELDRLDTTSQIRALRWLNDRYDPPIGVAGDMYPQPPANPNT
jgi:hypothetical protein